MTKLEIRDGSDEPMYPGIEVRLDTAPMILASALTRGSKLTTEEAEEFLREAMRHGYKATLRRWFTVVEDDALTEDGFDVGGKDE